MLKKPITPPAKPISIQSFINRLRQVSSSLPPSKKTFLSQSPNKPFYYKDPLTTSAPEIKGGSNLYNPNRWNSSESPETTSSTGRLRPNMPKVINPKVINNLNTKTLKY